MSFLKNIFGASESEQPSSNFNWNHLENLGQLDEIIELSATKSVLIFKHSTTCSISRMAFKYFNREFNLQNEIEIYYLDLLNFRTISNEIASRFEVVHQSPQILLIKNGVSVYNKSHENIDATKLKDLL